MLEIFLIIIPIFILLFIGKIVKILNLIDDNFVKSANKLIFNLCLPVLLFNKIANADIKEIFNIKLIVIMYLSVGLVYLICFLIAKIGFIKPEQAGSVMMNSFRSNFAYMGLPVSYYAYGDVGLLNASLLMAFIVPYVNMLSILALVTFKQKQTSLKFFKEVFLNPLAIACVLGITFSLININFADFIQKTLDLISGVTLPLALFCIGASLNIKSYGHSVRPISITVLMKLIVLPAIAFIFVYIFDHQISTSAKVLILLLASPAATVNFVLASTLGGDAGLTNVSIIISTLASMFTFIFWLSILGL